MTHSPVPDALSAPGVQLPDCVRSSGPDHRMPGSAGILPAANCIQPIDLTTF